jgi:hypothetical protein
MKLNMELDTEKRGNMKTYWAAFEKGKIIIRTLGKGKDYPLMYIQRKALSNKGWEDVRKVKIVEVKEKK